MRNLIVKNKYRCTVFAFRDENKNVCSPDIVFSPGAGYNSEGEQLETSGHTSVLGRPPSGIG